MSACDDSSNGSKDQNQQDAGNDNQQDSSDNSQQDADNNNQQDSGDNSQQDSGDDNSQMEPLTVTGPITGGKGKIWMHSVIDLDEYGYIEKEFFFEGDAISYSPKGDMTSDGKWTLEKSDKAQFKTRMMVRRPSDASEFNGTVVIEWLNVSGGTDSDPGFMYNYQEILREGYGWVGVSAQEVGIQGGGFALVSAAPPLKEVDPERYGSLTHPGDAYSYDIFTSAARVIRGAGDVDVLEGLKPKKLIAYGESQSAGRLVSYVNGVHPLVKEFDGFFIHSRFASSSPFGSNIMDMFNSKPSYVRDDLEEPIFLFETESDVTGSSEMGGYYLVRQTDTDRTRSWEVAGTSHADAYMLELNSNSEAVKEVGGDIMSLLPCEEVNDGPQQFVIKAALHALNLWITDGIEPPIGELLEVDDSGKLSTDEHGNALGGIRTPAVDVPIATLKGRATGSGNAMTDLMCGLFGQTIPFTSEELLGLYPTHDDYVEQVKTSASEAREKKFLLEPEEQAIIAEAEASSIPN